MEETNLTIEPLDAILLYANQIKEKMKEDPKKERLYLIEASKRLGLEDLEDIIFLKRIAAGEFVDYKMEQEEKKKMKQLIEAVTNSMQKRRKRTL